MAGAFGLPCGRKLQGKTTKVILRDWARQSLPRDLVERPKKGFGMPIARWLNGALRDWAHEELSPNQLAQVGVFNPISAIDFSRNIDEGKRTIEKSSGLYWYL